MKNTKNQRLVNFTACCLIAFGTYWVAWALGEYGKNMPIPFKAIDWVVIISILGILLRNIGRPVFWSPLIGRYMSWSRVIIFSLAYLALFESIVVYGFLFVDGYLDIYKKYMFLPQVLNLLWLWVLVCAMVGQKRFNSFVVVFMQNPWKAIGRALVDAVMGPPKL